MAGEQGNDPLEQFGQTEAQEHGDRSLVDTALWSILMDVMSQPEIGGIAKFVDDMTDPEATKEEKETFARAVLEHVLHTGISKGQIIERGNPDDDPDIATLIKFNHELAHPGDDYIESREGPGEA